MGKIVKFKWPKDMTPAKRKRTLDRISKSHPSAYANAVRGSRLKMNW